MLVERVEGRWIEAFTRTFELCGVSPGETGAILSETQSRQVNVALSELALDRLGARSFRVELATPRQTAPVPIRSTGASQAIGGLEPVVAALSSSSFVVDCTVEGLLHSPELPAVLGGGARVLMVSDEHPEILERLVPDPGLEEKVDAGVELLREASQMRVTSPAGTDLTIDVRRAPAAGSVGYTSKPGTIAHWPGGLCLCFPRAGTVNGTLVMDRGDVNLTFKRYLESAVELRIADDYVDAIEGDGTDAELMRSYFAAWDDRDAYAVSHVGWGMNPRARWDALTMYDKSQVNGTELRAFAGNFLYSTGANEVAGRHTDGHFDLPVRNCTIALDGTEIVVDGQLSEQLR